MAELKVPFALNIGFYGIEMGEVIEYISLAQCLVKKALICVQSKVFTKNLLNIYILIRLY